MVLTVRHYRAGDEGAEASVNRSIVGDWPWPSGYDSEDLQRLLADPSFDPKHWIYAFDGAEMVGLMHIFATATTLDGTTEAYAAFPKVLAGYEEAFEPMITLAAEALRDQGIETMTVWAHSKLPGAFEWLERHGFVEHRDYPKGIKKYVTYDLSRGPLSIPHDDVDDAKEAADAESIAYAVSVWNRCSIGRAKEIYAQWKERLSTIGHLVVRQGDEITACGLISRNRLRPEIAAFEYVYARDPDPLRQLTSTAVERCIEAGAESFLVDLVGGNHHFEPTYRDMGFELAVVHGWYSKALQEGTRSSCADGD